MIPSWLMWGLLGLWIAKDIVLYLFTWRSYDWDGADANHKMIGTSGIAKDRLNPSGYIIVRGELWKAEVAEGDAVIEKGEKVLVRGIQGLTLLVKAETEMNARTPLNHDRKT
ncbi:MAG: NfeD family protein [Deltaproteobacteria bacterium]|nr:NfeD family protein [Deltaproteobacteria bacterium]